MDFNGSQTSVAYDPMNRLTEIAYPGGKVSFSYDERGQRLTMSDSSGLTSYAYDDLGRLCSKQTPFGTLSYAFDQNSNVTRIRSSNAGGADVSYEYDALNRLRVIEDNARGGQVEIFHDPVATTPTAIRSSQAPEATPTTTQTA